MPYRSLRALGFMLLNSAPREANQHSHNAECAKNQHGDIYTRRRKHDRRDRQSRQNQVEQEYVSYDLANTESVIGGLLIKMRSMGVPKSLTVYKPSKQRD